MSDLFLPGTLRRWSCIAEGLVFEVTRRKCGLGTLGMRLQGDRVDAITEGSAPANAPENVRPTFEEEAVKIPYILGRDCSVTHEVATGIPRDR